VDAKECAAKQCAVCGLDDARALVTTSLAGGTNVIVCATHALIHRRGATVANTVAGLKAIAKDRRQRVDRRDRFPCDELAAQLTAGFVRDRREGRDRRA
jgi:hypothetical protein